MMSIAHMTGRAIRPPENLSVREWSDEKRVLPETSAEPGRWRTSRTPYMAEIMEDMTPGSDVREIAIMKAAQLGGTELLLNSIGHAMEVDPGPGLVVMSTQETSRSWSSKRLKPMINSTPTLRELFGSSRRNPKNRVAYKEFPGGFLRITYATSASELASDPIRYVWFDEVDKYPDSVDGEGDPVELAMVRTRTFRDRRRVVGVSTPSIKGMSRIERWFGEGDQRQYHLPCPMCDEKFVPELDMLVRHEAEAKLECPTCRILISEHHKSQMLKNGEWVPKNSDAPDEVRSYHLTGFLAPSGWLSWTDIMDQHEAAEASNDPDAMQVFVNSVLAKPFQHKESEQRDWNVLWARRGGCRRNEVPVGAAVLTSGVDVQGDRLECEIVGWGEGMRSWSVDYRVLPGDPSQPETWDQLDEVLREEYVGVEGARYRILRMAVDTGYLTNSVYRWARRHNKQRVMPVKGSTRTGTVLGAPSSVDVDVGGRRIKNGVWLWPVNVNYLKDELDAWLALEVPTPNQDGSIDWPDGWCEWPEYAPEYFKGICGEERVQRGNRLVWERVYKDQEPFDCRIYAMTAAFSLGLDRWSSERWTQELRAVQQASRHNEAVRPAVRQPRRAQDEETGQRRYTDSSYLQR